MMRFVCAFKVLLCRRLGFFICNGLNQQSGSNLKVVPVIDILNGKAVHAVRGKRKEYQPLQSTLCNSAAPSEVAKAFRNLGFSELYVADLDAIIGGNANLEVFRCMAQETGLKLMVDAGVTTFEQAQKLLESGVSKVIIGTETLRSKRFVGEGVKRFGSDHVIVSLDMRGDHVLVQAGFDGPQNALALLHDFAKMGVSQFIVLDLARVGSAEGVNVDFLKKVMGELQLDLYVGGGVRDLADLLELKRLDVAGVLLATALHTGKISVADLKQARLL
jgi:phosphoribosylformimino-5-aminoimidazole carboxamide ribotide isomerase